MSALRAAIVFLTRIPVGLGDNPPPLSAAVPWFPLVGAAIGAVVAGVYAAAETVLPPTLAAALAVTVGLLVTGAFHLDGLADMADAVAGGATRERRLEILEDSRLGTYGTAAVALQLITQVVAIGSLAPGDAFLALVAAHALGRAAAVALMGIGPPAKSHGLGVDYLADLSRVQIGVGVGLGLVSTVLLGWAGLSAIGAAILVVTAMAVLARRAFGGIGGDVLGATEQLTETAVLLVAVATV
ncbi:MAG: adenosylcobinamide-GDP ribazoletransferase [Acidimicrobiales bacterium]